MKPTFEFVYNGDEDDDVVSDLRVSILSKHLTRDELVEEFEHFVKGCGYYFSDDECIAITSRENI